MAKEERNDYTVMVMEDPSLKLAISSFLIGDTSDESTIYGCELRVNNTAALYCSCYAWLRLLKEPFATVIKVHVADLEFTTTCRQPDSASDLSDS